MTGALHQAVEAMDAAAVRTLIDAGVDIDQAHPDWDGARPLHIAVDIECEDALRRDDAGDRDSRPHATITRLLVDAGANPDLPDGNGASARDWARERNHQEALGCFGASSDPARA